MKKRLLSLLLALTLICSLLAFPASAAEIVGRGTCGLSGDNLTWTLDSDGVLTISGEGPMADYRWKGSPFYANQSITSVVVEPGVTSIGNYAFSGCSSLTSVTIPDSVTSIRDSTFYGCSSLTSVVIPDSVTSIGSYAFYCCSSLTGMVIPDSVTSIGSYAFYGCSSLTSVDIPDSVTSIGDYAFYGCSSLTSVTIPDSVTSIEEWTFASCSSLTSMEIPDSVTSIGDAAFASCSSLTGVVIPDSVTSIRGSAFQNCSSLASVTIPDSVTSIGYRAFQNCSSLTEVVIPDSVTGIGSYAFYGCSSLTSVEIPDSVTSIREYAFSGCSGLTSITIPNITTIPERAFQNCTGLESLTIESGLTTIDNYAFLGCSALKTVTLPDTLTNVNIGAFRNCDSIANVYYGGNSAQWAAIAIKSYNEPLTGANIHYAGSAPAKIESNPADATVPVGGTASFTVVASGDIASYQWQYSDNGGASWANSRSTTDTVTCKVTAVRNGRLYRCIVTDKDGNSVISNAAAVTVVQPVQITGSPCDNYGAVGRVAGFVVTAEGEGLTYQWQYSDNDGASWKNSTTNKSAVATCRITAARDGRLYRCVVTDAFGNVAVSEAAKIVVNETLAITTQPKDYTGAVGGTATFKVKATGENLTYQWQYSDDGGVNWKNSTANTTATATCKITAARDGRLYRCIVTAGNGKTVTSSSAKLIVK